MNLRHSKPIYWTAFWVGLLLLISACSTKKNRFTNRQYHRLNTKYNVMFNGQEALKMGETILSETIEDNFFDLLDVEPILLQGESENDNTVVPGFDRAEEKAVKAIQKHSMNIGGKQKNDQIDAAYLLLGKARYYDRRFFPALEAFNYLLENYSNPEGFVEALIWREKTNIRLYNYELAITNLRSLARGLVFKSRHYSPANATVAQAFIKLNNRDSAVVYIKRAAEAAKQPQIQGRYFYITGQLFEDLGQKDSAYWAYNQVVNLKKKTPRKFWINAKLKQLLLEQHLEGIDPEEEMTGLIDRYDNRMFKHTIYRALGILHLHQGNDSLAQRYLSLSQKMTTIDPPTKRANYRDLANYYFQKQNYPLAGAYLDSLLPLLPSQSLIQKRTQRERDNLEGVIRDERIVVATDSLLRIMALDTAQQRQYFENHLEKKRAMERASITAQKTNKGLFSRAGNQNQFYFYNPLLVVEGKQFFEANWGNRPNVDNWRWSNTLTGVVADNQTRTQTDGLAPAEIVLETAQSYLDRLPKTQAEKDSIIKRNHQAYLQLGMIYKEKFKNDRLAQNRLDTLETKNPEAAIDAPALYYLYKILENKDTTRARQLKQKITTKHPNTAYAQILKDSSQMANPDQQTPKAIYSKLLELFEQKQFDQLLQKANTYQVVLGPTEYAPRLDLLKANTIGRLQGTAAWSAALQEVIQRYPDTEISTTAQRLKVKSQMIDTTNTLKTLISYKWIFPLEKKDSLETKLAKQLQPIISKNRFWKLSIDSFNEKEVFVVVHGIPTPQKVRAIKNTLGSNSNLIIDLHNFVVLSKDYRQMLMDKNWTKTNEYEKH